MMTSLLFIIYIAFIGLGIPDSLFGTAWPAIYPEFRVTLSMANYITLCIQGCTAFSSLMSVKVIQKLGTAKVAAISTALTALALGGFSIAPNIWWMCLFAVPLGIGAGAIDSGLNNYVALHYKASHLNFLHCFYGIGVSFSPYLMSLVLEKAGGWRMGYRYAFILQMVITVLTFLSLPLWRKTGEEAADEKKMRSASFREIQKLPLIWATYFVFFGSCAIEFTCGVWGSTYFVNAKGVSVETAAEMIVFYYIGFTAGRFLAGVLASGWSSLRLVMTGQGIVAGALILLCFPLPAYISAGCLCLVGLGNGPIFPNMMYLTPRIFGEDISLAVVGTQYVATYLGIMLMPPVLGLLGQYAGMGTFPYFLLVMYGIMASGILHIAKNYDKFQKRH